MFFYQDSLVDKEVAKEAKIIKIFQIIKKKLNKINL